MSYVLSIAMVTMMGVCDNPNFEARSKCRQDFLDCSVLAQKEKGNEKFSRDEIGLLCVYRAVHGTVTEAPSEE